MTLNRKLALAAMLAAGAAFAANDPATSDTADRDLHGDLKARGTGGSGEASHDAAAAMSPTAVLSMIHQVNQDEIRLGHLAQTRASNDKVKDLAKDMVDDHTALDKRVSEVARDAKLTLGATQIPADKRHELTTMSQDAEQKLRAATGAQFDQAYVQAMSSSHAAVLRDLDAALPGLKGNGQDKIHDLVSDARDKVRDHQKHADDLLRSLGGSAVGGSGPESARPATK